MPKKPTTKTNPTTKKRLIIGLSVLLALILLDLSPFGGNIRFYTTWVNCGGKPVQLQSWGGMAWYEESPTFTPFLRNQSWLCSPLEAEKHGYSANPNYYEAPELKKHYGEYCVNADSPKSDTAVVFPECGE